MNKTHTPDAVGNALFGNGYTSLLAERDRLKSQVEELRGALEGLLADITEYQTINKLGGENNHWQVIARAALAKGKP